MGFRFESGGLTPENAAHITADLWADLPFDREALAAVKRDGVTLDGINLGGQSPYTFSSSNDETLEVSAAGPNPNALLDLWRVYFLRGLRMRALAA